jgi:hypothetical protein
MQVVVRREARQIEQVDFDAEEVVNVALAIANAVTAIRAGKFEEPDVNLEAPRAK